MSLINEMLKDLEARWPGRQDGRSDMVPDSVATNSVSYAVGAPAAGRGRMPRSGFLSLGRLLMIAFGVFLFAALVMLDQRRRSEETSPVVLVERPSHAPAPAPMADKPSAAVAPLQPAVPLDQLLAPQFSAPALAVSQPAPEAREPAAFAPAEPAPPARDGALRARIEGLLAAADEAFTQDQLTTPRADNALDRYQAVLVIEPDNARAMQGLKRIQQRYLTFMRQAAAEGEMRRVTSLEERALLAGLPLAELEAFKSALADTGVEPRSSPAATALATAPSSAAVFASTPTSIPAAAPAGLTPGFSSADQQTAEQAAALLARGENAAARALLSSFVGQNPQSRAALRSLFEIYLAEGQNSAAARLLAAATRLPPDVRAFLSARLDVQQERYTDALQKLLSAEPGRELAAAYYSLRSGIQYKLGDYAAAAQGYRSLIGFDGQNPSYWLGLAVALDASRQDGALAAFERVKQLAEDDATYAAYVRERIASLSIDR